MEKQENGFSAGGWAGIIALIAVAAIFGNDNKQTNKGDIMELKDLKEIKEKLKKSKLKLLEKVNEKLDSDTLTTEDLKNISATLSNVISYSDYAETLYGFGAFNGCACSTTAEIEAQKKNDKLTD